MIELTLSIFSAIIGGFIGAFLSYHYNRKSTREYMRVQNTLLLYEEFNSDTMLNSRRIADNYLHSHKDKSLDNVVGYEYPEGYHVSRILHFFCKIEAFHRLKYIDVKLAKEFFSGHYEYWYTTHFQYYHSEIEKDYEFWYFLSMKKWINTTSAN